MNHRNLLPIALFHTEQRVSKSFKDISTKYSNSIHYNQLTFLEIPFIEYPHGSKR